MSSEPVTVKGNDEKLTSDGEHLQPVSFLNDTNKYDEADDNKGKDGELLGEIIHIEL